MSASPKKYPADATELIVESKLVEDGLTFSQAEKDHLRSLAGTVAELSVQPIESEKRDLWLRHNMLQSTRPLVFCDPEGSWREIVPDESLQCENTFARDWEFNLRAKIFRGKEMRDDRTIDPYFDVSHVRTGYDWGLEAKIIGAGRGNAYRWDPPVKTEADIAKLHFPTFKIDTAGTERLAEIAEEIFGDLLSVRIKSSWWWSLGMTNYLVNLRGLDQILFDMLDNPQILHAIMSVLSSGFMALLDALTERKLLSLNCDGSYVGSGGFGWTDELPQADFDGTVRPCDMWGFAESQETVGVSQDMFEEFVLRYQLPILSRFGLNCYGCCEPVDDRWEAVKKVPNLRRISVSPWSKPEKMAAYLGQQYIYSMKPNPSDLAMDNFDEARIRQKMRNEFQTTRNCIVEAIMKDTHTIRNDPTRVIRWVQITKEEAEKL
ncbi:hypothetical protein JXJ21_20890 [candidate division KSB1 bacterium]|nr:hypothetical protein [candidate division KSB1 bacterium]